MLQMTEVITDAVHSNARILWTPRRIIQTSRDGTTLGDCDVAVRPPWANCQVMIRGIGVPLIRWHIGSLVVLNKWKSTSLSASSNT